ncbi:MAG: host-nuclease inhibitor Gam family protein [Pseudomonadota bacterium]
MKKDTQTQLSESSSPCRQAEALLARLGRLAARIAALEFKVHAEMESIRARHPQLGELRFESEILDARLKDLLKSERQAIFAGRDKVVLRSGILLRGLEQKMAIPRNALNLIKELGWVEGLRVSEALNRAVVESWPPDRLAVIGVKMREVEKFAYEVTAV